MRDESDDEIDPLEVREKTVPAAKGSKTIEHTTSQQSTESANSHTADVSSNDEKTTPVTEEESRKHVHNKSRQKSEGFLASEAVELKLEESETNHGIKWGDLPFQGGQNMLHTTFSRQDHRKESRRTGSISVAAEKVRRASHDVLDSINVLRDPENPLNLQINEIRRVSAGSLRPDDAFDGRTSLSQNRRGRKPSLYPDPHEFRKFARADDDPDDFIIQRLAAHDDIDLMPPWKRYLYATSPLWGVLTLGAYFTYLAFRVIATLDAQNAVNKTFGLAWTFIVVELGVAIPMVMHRVWSMLMVRGRRRPKLRIVGNSVPSVDVVITCCGEDDELTFNTALAACNIDYPADRFRVMILDDGASAGLRALVEDQNKNAFTNMYYYSRPKYPGVPHHFKAGNLNFGLAQTKLLQGGAANFFAALDADMIPTKDWLRALLPHMLQDNKCSMACPPQQFYNVPTDDLLCQSLDTFVHISEPVKDALGVAWCTGSGYVMRRDALESIDNFPLGSLAEDVCTSSMFLGAGWNTAFVHEPLQFGTVPDSFSGHLKQRTRWTIGTVQTSLKLRFCLFGPLVKQMSVMQKLSGFVYTISSLFTIFLVLSLFTIPVVLYQGGTMVPYATREQLVWLIRLNFIAMVTSRINEYVTYLPSGYFVGQRDARGILWMAPYHAMSVFQSFLLPKWLGGKIAVFTSSGSQSSELNERDAVLRAPLMRRLKVILWNCKAWFHLTYVFFALGSVILSIYRVAASPQNKYPDPARGVTSTESYLLDVLTHAGWPPMLWLICVVSCFAPIQYAIFPPTVPSADALLEREERKDGGLGPAYPTAEAKKIKQSKRHVLHEIQYTLLCLYQAVVFAWSFYL